MHLQQVLYDTESCDLRSTGFHSVQGDTIGMVSFSVVICCTIAYLVQPVTSNENVFNGHVTAFVPGIIQDIWHVPDFIAFPKDGNLPNAVSGFVPAFPMPYDLQALLERRNSFSLKIMKRMSFNLFFVFFCFCFLIH